MQRIKLGKPYEKYIKSVIDAGYFSSATEVIRDALRYKMNLPYSKEFLDLLKEGIDDFENERVVPLDDKFWDNMRSRVNSHVKQSSSIPNYITGENSEGKQT